MPRPLDKLRQVRLGKLEALKKVGVNPYPSKFEGSTQIERVREAKLGSKARTAGRIAAWRSHGALVFADLVDSSGKIQILFQQNELPTASYKLLDFLDIGDFLGVSGETFKTQAGELTIKVESFALLAKSLRPLPSKSGFKDIEERYRQRYADLLANPETREVFERRTKIIRLLRRFMDEHGFFEVETPTLQPIYGGASAKPFVTHHNTLDTDFYLRISDELYLKRMVVGGFEKVYEIGHVFRNEGIDRAHNPEFTMMEFYWAYASYEDLIKFSEEMISSVVKEVCGSLKVDYEGQKLDFTPPWPRKTYRQLLQEATGIDIDKVKTEEALREAVKEKKLKIGFGETHGYGDLCDKLYKEYIRPKIIQPTLVLDYPAEMIALAKRKEEDPSKVASFQLLVNGAELIKAYNELNDPLEQKERWEEEEKLGKKGLEEHMVTDEDYIRALECGMPPTAGWGLGIDRFVAILTGQPSLKDVILFPTLRPHA